MADLSITAVPPQTRLVLRAGEALAVRLGAAFAVDLPQRMLTATTAGARAALMLGPDEWLLLAEDGAAAEITAVLEAARGGAAASLVDVSHRFSGLSLQGAGAVAVLQGGCPLDLDAAAFPPGHCTRTVFGKVEVVLWRQAEHAWRLECGRSFAAYLSGSLAVLARQ